MNGSRPTSRNERRRKDFKKGVDAEDARRKREDNIVQLRKDKRDENLQKKRAVFPSSGVGGAIEDSTRAGGSAAQKVGALFVPTDFECCSVRQGVIACVQLERLPYMVQGVWSENLEQQIDATTQFRKLLSIGEYRPINPA